MIDFHSHIIYKIDDGAENISMSIEMLNNSESEGVQCICATPHFIFGNIEPDKEEYLLKLNNLQKSVNIKILPGLEIYMDNNLPELFDEGKIWGINNKKYMLIEFPMGDVPKYSFDVLYELTVLGIVPIIAHPERNRKINRDITILEELIKEGYLVQLNGGSLSGEFGETSKEFSERLVKRNMVHVLGSDGHDDIKRKTNLKDAFVKLKNLNPNLYNWIIDNENAIICGEDVELPIVLPEKKKRRFFGR